ncbi:alpha/beta hydrolase [Alphaproteobacteria bacterium]|nr:alpha/beta hydrolase [Alphaproteobacteria bacterium]
MNDAVSADWEALIELYPPLVTKTRAGDISIRTAGAGPDVVLLHGIGSGSGSWVYQLVGLSPDYRVIAWDAPSYGASAPVSSGTPSVNDYAARLAALVDALSLDRFLLVGHSLGALIAGRYAALQPERLRGMVLADPAAGHARLPEEDRAARFNARLKSFAALGPERYAEQRAGNLLRADTTHEHLSLVRRNMAQLTMEGLSAAARILSAGDLLSDVAQFDGPAIVLCGSEDKVTPPDVCRPVADAFPGGRTFHLIEAAGHASYIDAPDIFTCHIVDFEKSLTV